MRSEVNLKEGQLLDFFKIANETAMYDKFAYGVLQLFLHIRHAGYITLIVQAYKVYVFQLMSFSLVQET
jgi:hypothetical protein